MAFRVFFDHWESNDIMSKKILMLGNSKLVIFGFRGELIEKFIFLGYEVYVSFPSGPFGEGEEISKQYGCHFIETEIDRRGKNPFKDLKTIKTYKKIIKDVKPDYVLSYTIKCNIYGGMAAKKYKVPFMPNITGIGKGLYEKGLTQKITKFLYKKSLKKAKCVFFQNEHDIDFFKNNKLYKGEYVLLPGSGVNLEKFKYSEMPNDDIVKFTFNGRLMKAKGIEEYLEVAQRVKKEYPNTEFHVCGFCEEDYKSQVEKLNNDGIVIYHGLVDNISEINKMCHCVVLPSFHPEGISNVLLEAAACGRAIITTNHFGCKETVDDGVTGFLIEPKNVNDLYEKVILFLNLDYKNKIKMGIEGRKKVEKNFDRKIIVDEYVKKLEK